jgi:L-asparaginase
VRRGDTGGSPALVVTLTRGGIVEARHRIHAVAVQGGRRLLQAGDPSIVSYFRSSAKPIQALPLVRERPDLGDAEIALACASHLAAPEQLAAVRRLLAAASASESDLETGADPTPFEHTCSGKHAGFLAVCRARGWPFEGYHRAEHPCQRAQLEEVANAAEVDPEGIPLGVDGCGVPTFALSLERMAHAFARLPELEGGARTVSAMRANPDLIRGPLAADAVVMRELPGWTAKGGAEGLMCAVGPDGIGVALKVEDGNSRAVAAGLAEVLHRLGFPLVQSLAREPVENSRGEKVGEVRVAP